MGLLPSASVGIHTSVFEPIHGSWPQAAGQNIANPLATVLSAAMMFDYAFHLPDEAALIRAAVDASLAANARTADIQVSSAQPLSTSQVGDWLVDWIKAN